MIPEIELMITEVEYEEMKKLFLAKNGIADNKVTIPEEEWEIIVDKFTSWWDSPASNLGGEYFELAQLLKKYIEIDDGWINVQDRFPEKYVPVLVEGGVAHYEGDYQGFHKWWSHESDRTIQWEVVRWKEIKIT